MAKTNTSRSTIDNLPEVKRQQVLDALMAGVALRKIAEMAGCSAPAVLDYKRKVVLPALRTAKQVQQFQGLESNPNVQLTEQARLTRDIVRASPFRDRLEKLWERTDKSLDQAEQNKELGVMAPLLNQAHKNCEMLGRATGELEQSAGNAVQIQIVMPAGPAYGHHVEAETVEIAMPKR